MLICSEKTDYNVTKSQSRIFLSTSSLTLIPIYIAFSNKLYFHAITSIGTYLFAILYWHNPKHGWRRNLDLFYAKYTFIIYFGSGILFLPKGIPSYIFYSSSLSILSMYLSTLIFPKKWVRFHILLHILSVITKTYIILYLKQSLSSK